MSVDFNQLTHDGIRTLVPYKPGKSIDELRREKGITDSIKMASNENPLGCCPKALQALHTIDSRIVAAYPSPINHALMPKLADRLGIPTEQLFLSNGSDPIFGLLINCFALHSNKHIVTHQYAFSTYEIQARSLNVPVRIANNTSQWDVCIESLLQICDENTAVIFLANPNNPTGALTPASDLKYLLEQLPETTIVVLDEAYYEYAKDEFHANSLEWINTHPNLVITRTFSKIYGMAGLRMGYAVSSPSIIKLLHKVQLPFTVNQAALTAASAALDDEVFIQQSLKINSEGKKQLRAGFDSLGMEYLPTSCNFLTCNCKEDGLLLFNYLLQQGIIVRPLHAYSMNNYLRVTIGTKEQNVRFLNALEAYL